MVRLRDTWSGHLRNHCDLSVSVCADPIFDALIGRMYRQIAMSVLIQAKLVTEQMIQPRYAETRSTASNCGKSYWTEIRAAWWLFGGL